VSQWGVAVLTEGERASADSAGPRRAVARTAVAAVVGLVVTACPVSQLEVGGLRPCKLNVGVGGLCPIVLLKVDANGGDGSITQARVANGRNRNGFSGDAVNGRDGMDRGSMMIQAIAAGRG